jgi:tetraacyldisaccharide 4'-kinase
MHWYLLPFSLLYAMGVNVRNKLFDWGIKTSKSYDIPVISVGNISVGGTGKTPHTEFLINLLKDKYKLTALSRGYKRKSKGFFEVQTSSAAEQVGDEALQIKLKYPKIRVIVDEKRVHAIDKLLHEDSPPEVFILDDAFQHRYVEPGLNILLMDYQRPITKDFLLPVGRLREPAYNSHRANIIILTKCPQHLTPIDFRIMQKELNVYPYQHLFFTTFAYNQVASVFNEPSKTKHLIDLKGMHLLSLTGIANPALFYKKLNECGAQIEKIAYPDHHSFTATDIEKIKHKYKAIATKNKAIICTEKDAVKLRTKAFKKALQGIPVYYLPIKVRFMNNEEDKFNALINKYMNRFYDK